MSSIAERALSSLVIVAMDFHFKEVNICHEERKETLVTTCCVVMSQIGSMALDQFHVGRDIICHEEP